MQNLNEQDLKRKERKVAKSLEPYATLAAAMAPYRATYIGRFVELELEHLTTVHEQLRAKDMNAGLVAPYPHMLGRLDYLVKVAAYEFVRDYFERDETRTPAYASLTTPYYVKLRADALTKLTEKTLRVAGLDFDSFIIKLAKKIGIPVLEAGITGVLWEDCTLVVEVEGGERQTWSTKCITNHSIYGTPYSQWPSRRVKHKL